MEQFATQSVLFPDNDDLLPVMTDEQINQKYVVGDVRIVTEQARYPLSSIAALVESQDYELNPEFQRRHRWDAEKQSRLIESFIMNVPIPPIFLYEVRYSKYEVMDGLQRLTAIYEFYKDRLTLQGLTEWAELNGRTYSQLPDQIKNGVNRRYLSSIILLQETAKNEDEATRLKQLVFERLNSGGTKLEPQESRNAIYNGPLNQLCIKLARNPFLCRMWGIPEPTDEEMVTGKASERLLKNELYRRMDDVELVLRFIAYRHRLESRNGSLKDFLDNFLKRGNKLSRESLKQSEELFNATVKLVYETLGERAFWLWRQRSQTSWNWFSRPAITAYDPIMYVFSYYAHKADVISDHKEEIRQRMPQFYEDNYSAFGGRNTTNLANIMQRNSLFQAFISDIVGY